MADKVDNFFQKTRRSDDRGYATMCVEFFSYCCLAVTLVLTVLTYLLIVHSKEDLSVRVYNCLWLYVEIHVFVLIVTRLYYQPQFRDMFKRSQIVGIPENFSRKISTVIKFYFIMSNVFVAVPLLYTISFDSGQMGNSFSFPFPDVLLIKTTGVTVYACKYILYALPVYIVHFEACFMNSTFMYSSGVVTRHFQILDKQVEEAMVDKDEQKLKIAIKHHQEILKYFRDMKTIYEKPILMGIEFCGFYIGLSSFIMIQVIQGFIHRIMLAVCITSTVSCLITISIYSIYASNMYDLHDGILNSLFEYRSCYSRNKPFKHLILMMMTRASIPLEFKVGSMVVLNLNLLVKILKFAYTVFNVLLTSINRQLKETAI